MAHISVRCHHMHVGRTFSSILECMDKQTADKEKDTEEQLPPPPPAPHLHKHNEFLNPEEPTHVCMDQTQTCARKTQTFERKLLNELDSMERRIQRIRKLVIDRLLLSEH
jgi:hypothetical protein